MEKWEDLGIVEGRFNKVGCIEFIAPFRGKNMRKRIFLSDSLLAPQFY